MDVRMKSCRSSLQTNFFSTQAGGGGGGEKESRVAGEHRVWRVAGRSGGNINSGWSWAVLGRLEVRGSWGEWWWLGMIENGQLYRERPVKAAEGE